MTKDQVRSTEEALKLALEALDTASHGLYKATPHFDTHKMIEQVEASITAIKQALAAPVQEPAALKPCWYESKEKTMCRKCGQVHAEAIPPAAQPAPVQEPVAQYSDIVSDGGLDPRNKFDLPPTAQRWAVFCGGCRKEWSVPYQHPGKSICVECEAKCATTPPAAQRQWVGLDGFEQKELMAMPAREAVFAAEARLKEKNT
jgi:hypothetical protein